MLYRRRRFVSWLADQIEAGRPYDATVRDLVAGEGLWTDQPGTNFVTATIAQYNVRDDERTVTVAGAPVAAPPPAAVASVGHELFIFGVRGTFNP